MFESDNNESSSKLEPLLFPASPTGELSPLHAAESVADSAESKEGLSTVPMISSKFNMTLLFLFQVFSVAMLVIFYSAAAFIYTPVKKMSLTWASAVNYINSIFNIGSLIAIAYYGDNIKSQYGKRKPLLLLFWPITAVSSLAMLFPPEGLDAVGVEMWYLMCQVLMTISYACFGSVYGAWFIESCANSTDYRTLSTYSFNIGGGIGAALGLAFTTAGMQNMAVIVTAIGATVSLIAVLYFIPHRVVSISSHQPPVLSSVRILSHTQEFRTVLLNKVVIFTAYYTCAEFLYYISFICFPNVQHYKQLLTFYIIFAIVGAVAAVPSVLVLNYLLSLQMEKIKLYMQVTQGFVVLAGLLLVIYIPGLVMGSSLSNDFGLTLFWLWMIVIIFGSFMFSGAIFLEGLIVRDLIRYDTFCTGLNRENMYQSALGVPASIISQFLYSIPLCIFTTTGFRNLVPVDNDDLLIHKASWNEGSHIQIVIYSSLLYGLGALASYYWFRRYPLVESVTTKIEEAIRKRDERKEMLPQVLSLDPDNAQRSVNSKSDDLSLGSFTDDDEEMRMNHFSHSELLAMSTSESSASTGKSLALNRITNLSRLNLFLVCPATLAATLAGLAVQIIQESQYQVLVVNLFCFSMIFGLYESLRLKPIQELGLKSGIEVMLLAKSACRKNADRGDALREMLSQSGIDADDPLGQRDTLAVTPTHTRDEQKITHHPTGSVSGDYIVMYSVQAGLIIVGVLFALVIK